MSFFFFLSSFFLFFSSLFSFSGSVKRLERVNVDFITRTHARMQFGLIRVVIAMAMAMAIAMAML